MSFISLATTRFPNGFTDNNEQNILNAFGQPDPTKYFVIFNDFATRTATDGTTVQWTDVGSVALAAANNGVVVLTAANTDEALVQTQMTTAAWLPDITKKFWFKTRLKVSSNSLADVFVGLSIVDTTLIAASALGMTDGFGLFKGATDTTWTLTVRKDATTGALDTTSIGTNITSDTFFTLGMYYDGNGHIYYAIDDTVLGSITVTSSYWPDAQLSPSLALGQEGTAGANLMTVDYVFFAAER